MARAVAMGSAALLLLVLATIPFFQNASTLSKKITTRKKEADELSKKVTILSGLDQEVLKQRVETLDQALPPKKDVVLYLTAIDGLSKELELNFGGISLSPGEVTEATKSADKNAKKSKADALGLHTLDTNVKIDGREESIYSFLKTIENSTPLMQIKDVKVTSQEDGVFSLSLQLGMLWAAADIGQVKGQIELFDSKEEAYFRQLADYRHIKSIAEIAPIDTGLGKADLFEEFGVTTLQQ